MNVYYGRTCGELQIHLLFAYQVRNTSGSCVGCLITKNEWAGNAVRQVLSKPLGVVAVHLNA